MKIADQQRLMLALDAFFDSLERSQKQPKDLALFAEMARKRDDLQLLYESIKNNLSS